MRRGGSWRLDMNFNAPWGPLRVNGILECRASWFSIQTYMYIQIHNYSVPRMSCRGVGYMGAYVQNIHMVVDTNIHMYIQWQFHVCCNGFNEFVLISIALLCALRCMVWCGVVSCCAILPAMTWHAMSWHDIAVSTQPKTSMNAYHVKSFLWVKEHIWS